MYRIVYNACIDELRRTKRRPDPVDLTDHGLDLPDGGRGPDGQPCTADATRRALAVLPDDQRITVVMVDGEGLDNQTVATLLDVAPGTVASRLSRARATMRLSTSRSGCERAPRAARSSPASERQRADGLGVRGRRPRGKQGAGVTRPPVSGIR